MDWRITYNDAMRRTAAATSDDTYYRMQALGVISFGQLMRNIGIKHERIKNSPYYQYLLWPREPTKKLPRWYLDVQTQFNPVSMKLMEFDVMRRMNKIWVFAVIKKKDRQIVLPGVITPSRLADYPTENVKGKPARLIPVWDLVPLDDIFDRVEWEIKDDAEATENTPDDEAPFGGAPDTGG